MNQFDGPNWRINLLPEWVGEHEEDCSIVFHPEGVGALEISCYFKEGTVTEEDLRGLAQEHIEAGAKLTEASAGDFKGFTLAFGSDNEFWQLWYVASGPTALFITYNCQAVDRDAEIESIKSMVSSLAAIYTSR
ncbi:hypothetical protein [Marinobacter nauticus]|uniref:DUF3805 domain-containing protein n=1 Tax=Marinobacter nauticus TaxID=2743 RepID=A0A368UR87_MARNT|nr:hypothetical protein [Marinobacter nauticus]RBP68443.1 hypothetical protein DET64_1262 [Marinobacter nauticus]RCW29341.1 hypothetical protein DET51_1262 [Marinobacter nauticus]TPW22675.1 hypothetical protein FH712_15005 [Marinobacter nauticus]